MTISLPVLTHSSASTLLACARKYWWAYVHRIRRSSVGSALGIGVAYHAGLETIGKGGTLEQAVEVVRACVLSELDSTITQTMLAGHEWRWSGERYKALATELVFEFRPSTRSRFKVAGKIDGIIELADGRVAVIEYKTTSEDITPGSDYWHRLNIDRQVSTYLLAAQSLGHPASTVLYDVIRKPGIRPRLLKRSGGPDGARESMTEYAERMMAGFGEKPAYYFGRAEIPRLESDLEAARREWSDFSALLKWHAKGDRWPRNSDACVTKFGACPYFRPCAGGHNLETDGVPDGYLVVPEAHAELTDRSDNDNEDAAAPAA